MQLEHPFQAELCSDEHHTAAEGGHKTHVAGEAGRPLCGVDTGRFYDLTVKREVVPAEFA